MIGTIITGRGNNRSVIERPRNMAFSQALAASICTYLRIPANPSRKVAKTRALAAQYGKR